MKKLSLIALFALISMLFFAVSCGSDEDEEGVDTDTVDTQADTTADTQSDTDADTATDTATDTTADTATDTDADTSTDTATDTDADTSTDTATDTEDDTSADTATDTDADTSADTATDTDADTTDSGTDTDADTDADTSADTGDDSNLNNGDTSGNQAQSGKVGAACTKDSQCTQTYGSGDSGQEAVCLFESSDGFPGGYCSFLGDGTDSAACSNTGELFYNFGGGWGGDGLCLHRCTKPSDCRKGYRCSNKVHACLPDCKASGYECVYGQCDQTDGVCVKK